MFTETRQYKDASENPCTLDWLVKNEPEWAANQIRHRDKLESELAEANSKVQHLLNHCQDAECSYCAEIVCKYHEPLHFHHDGCPSCENAPSAEQIGKAWMANSSLERWFPITSEELERLREEVRVLKSPTHG